MAQYDHKGDRIEKIDQTGDTVKTLAFLAVIGIGIAFYFLTGSETTPVRSAVAETPLVTVSAQSTDLYTAVVHKIIDGTTTTNLMPSTKHGVSHSLCQVEKQKVEGQVSALLRTARNQYKELKQSVNTVSQQLATIRQNGLTRIQVDAVLRSQGLTLHQIEQGHIQNQAIVRTGAKQIREYESMWIVCKRK